MAKSNKQKQQRGKNANAVALNNISLNNVKQSRLPVVYDNTTEDIIIINESKARLIYKEHMQHKVDFGIVLAWLGVAVSCLIAVLTSNFERTAALHKDLPKMIIVGFIIYCLYSSYKVIQNYSHFKKNEKKYTDQTFIEALKSESNLTDIVE